MKLYPLKLLPVTKEIVWGGHRLIDEFNKNTTGNNIAESWELTVRPDGMNIIDNGPCKGQTLAHYLGDNAKDFPLLIKLIDAKTDLSIQVHPDDAFAKEHEGEFGKTEMWYIVGAQEGAKLVYGVKNYTKEAFAAAIETGTIESHMNYVSVKNGDVFFIPAGLVHAIGGGILIAEIQQSSNVTYRVYDYNRQPARELHIEKATAVIIDRSEEEIEKIRFENKKDYDDSLLAACKYFTVNHYKLIKPLQICKSNSFRHVLCLEGTGAINDYVLTKGDSFFLPAGIDDVKICGNVEIIVSGV